MSLEEYLLMARGPKHLALEVVVPIYCAIFLTGVLGNLAICVVIANNKNMHTATNYYLFSLAVTLLLLAAVVITFFLCWVPFHAQRLLYIYGREWTHYYTANEWLYYIAGCFYYFSSTVNPVLYNIMSLNYSNAIRATLFGRRNREYHSSIRESYVDGRWQRTLT